MIRWPAVLPIVALMLILARLIAVRMKGKLGSSAPKPGSLPLRFMPSISDFFPSRAIGVSSGFGMRVLAALAGWDIYDDVTEGKNSFTPRSDSENSPEECMSRTKREVSGLVSNRNYEGRELSGMSFAGAALSGLNFAHATLRGANLSRASLAGSVLIAADLRSADMSRANAVSGLLVRADLTGADLSWANLAGANLDGACLLDAALIGVTWSTETVWPRESREDIERISIKIAPDVWKILPVEVDDRILI